MSYFPKVVITDSTGAIIAEVDAANALYVSGKSAVGSTPSSNPLYIAGVDSGGLKRGILTDTKGKILVSSEDPFAKNISVYYNATFNLAAAYNFIWTKMQYYTVPASFKFFPSKFWGTCSTNRDMFRLSKFLNMGAFNVGTQVFTDGSAWSSPVFSVVEAEITTIISNNATTLSVTYVNQDGTGGKTGTLTIPANAPVGTKYQMAFAVGDTGVQDITNVTRTAGGTGIVQLNGNIELSRLVLSTALAYYTNTVESVVGYAGEIFALDAQANANDNATREMAVLGLITPA